MSCKVIAIENQKGGTGSGVNLTVSNPFKEGTKYTVTYYLTAKDGYKCNSATACTINGSVASIAITVATHAKISLKDLVPGDGKKEITSLIMIHLNI